ncbi:ABC1-domain-containing protein [Delitschia confertaspora ATCC 74209]|uniref:ABC1-domain-containing protein n=1 Tax=Delitschia confertaspora ATCC 74209 TaxID=1513339 RepID=A0A9P4MX85_9PLEO|nr:ABC1-domain-containing protein [Delitschia confertaspora ATCC 74209]
MAGRRLLDAAKLFNASKSIAKQHITLRQQQLDLYSKTSSLAKALKNQTDRVTLTAQAAIALSNRFNDSAPPPYTASFDSAETPVRENGNIPKKDTVHGGKGSGRIKEGLEPDHHYTRSKENATTAPVVDHELPIQQEEAERRPLPDGTIPISGTKLEGQAVDRDTFSERATLEPPKAPLADEPIADLEKDEGIKPISSAASTIPTPSKSHRISSEAARKLQRQAEFHVPSTPDRAQPLPQSAQAEKLSEGRDRDILYNRSVEGKAEYSSLPRTKIPKHTEDKQMSHDNVDDGKLDQEVFYSTPKPGEEKAQKQETPQEVAVPDQEQIPEGINTDVFRTKRVAQMLGGNPYVKKPHLDLKDTRKTLYDHTKLAGGEDQDIFSVCQTEQTKSTAPAIPILSEQASKEKDMHDFASQLAKDVEVAVAPVTGAEAEAEKAAYQLRESRVPSSRFGRFWQYAGLGTSMALGAVGEGLRRVTGTAAAAGGSLMLSPANIEILVAKLSRMRGAALKLGQMISIQDMKMLPPAIHEVLQRVQDSADYMPASQRDKVLAKNLGPDWRELFESFDEVPIAAASIGQVHKAILRSTGKPVAVKVQYPGVSNSIDSDLNNLSILLTASRLLPKGLYLDKTIANARTELGWECDYVREAECQTRFRDLLADDTDVFTVPAIVPEACGPQVLTADLMYGIGVAKLPKLDQEQRDWIGTQILRLCLREIVEFKFMQTDPNWTNFLYNEKARKIELLDFGASRDYPDEFVDPYINVLIAASQGNKSIIRDLSIQLGYLTGSESQAMLDAHIESVLTLAEPFRATSPEVYDFRDQTITDRVRSLIPVMVKERLAPPPEETYSLHRKLSGAFLLCARLGSRVPCRELFQRAVETYRSRGVRKMV